MKKELKKKNRILLASYLVIAFLALLPLFNIAFNSSNLFFGIPLSVLWLLICFLGFCLTALWGYKNVFHRWGEETEKKGDNEK